MLSTAQTIDPLRRWRLLVIAALFLLLAACSLSSSAKQERLARHVADGEVAWQARDYEAARSAYGAAHLLAPADAPLAFRLGMVHEYLGGYAEAATLYRVTLKGKDLPTGLQHEMTYRLALLEAFRLDGAAQVPNLLATLPPTSPYAADLKAVLALLTGDGRKALVALNEARTHPLSQELSSIILYHAARAYYLVGDVDRALQSLYEAINRGGYAPVSRDIGEFRELVLKQPRH